MSDQSPTERVTCRVAVHVMPKSGILDPQGRAVEQSLPHLGVAGVRDVRVGRRVELGGERREGGGDEERGGETGDGEREARERSSPGPLHGLARTSNVPEAVRPQTSGEYIAETRVGGTTKRPIEVARVR